MTEAVDMQRENLEPWWKAHFRWHPFEKNDAAQEEHLGKYFVEPPFFEEIARPRHSILYAPLGGGKTAARRMVERMCEAGDIKGVMSVTCDDFSRVLQEAGGNPFKVTEDMLVEEVMRRTAVNIFDFLAKKPEVATGISDVSLQWVAVFLEEYIWREGLEKHLLGTGLSAMEFEKAVERGELKAKKASIPADYHPRLTFLARLKNLRDQDGNALTFTSSVKLEMLVNTVKLLDFEAVYILLDGVDGLPKTSPPQGCAAVVKPLLDSKTLLSVPDLYFKLFLPAETQPLLANTAGISSSRVVETELVWTEENLIKLLRERLKVASNGTVESLDALCEPALRGRIDKEIVRLAKNPRQLIVLGRRLIDGHKEGPEITKEEFKKLKDYIQKRAFPEISLTRLSPLTFIISLSITFTFVIYLICKLMCKTLIKLPGLFFSGIFILTFFVLILALIKLPTWYRNTGLIQLYYGNVKLFVTYPRWGILERTEKINITADNVRDTLKVKLEFDPFDGVETPEGRIMIWELRNNGKTFSKPVKFSKGGMIKLALLFEREGLLREIGFIPVFPLPGPFVNTTVDIIGAAAGFITSTISLLPVPR